MAINRRIIADAVQGDLVVEWARRADVASVSVCLDHPDDGTVWVADFGNSSDALFFATYSPEHVDVMEDAIAAAIRYAANGGSSEARSAFLTALADLVKYRADLVYGGER